MYHFWWYLKMLFDQQWFGTAAIRRRNTLNSL